MENEQITVEKRQNSKYILRTIVIVVIGLIIVGAVWYSKKDTEGTPTTTANSGEYAVAGITNAFGANLKMVSLMGSAADVAEAMERQYKPFVTPELLAKWKADPKNAPGRLTSSPYPDKIEIASVSKVSSISYKVTGNIVDVTNGSKGATQVAAVHPIVLTYENREGTWLIADAEMSPQSDTKK